MNDAPATHRSPLRRLLLLVSAAALLVTVIPAGASADHVDVTDDDGLVTSVRWSGGTRYDTASKLAVEATAAAVARSANAAILATGETFPDALAGSYLAGAVEAPILLTRRDALADETRARLTGDGDTSLADVETIYLLGGPVAISETVEREVEDLGFDVVRLAGADRVETAASIATEAPGATPGEVGGLTTAILATSQNFPDALVAGATAHAGSLPLLLTARDTLEQHAVDALEQLDIEQVVVAGGPVAIAESVLDELRTSGYQVRRVAGDTRDATAVAFAEFNADELDFDDRKVGLARNDDFPDALAFAPYAGREGFSITLTSPIALPDVTATHLRDIATCQFDALYVPGGPVAVSDDVEQDAREALSVEDCAGVDNDAPSLVSATTVDDSTTARDLPDADDDVVVVTFDEAVTCTDDAPFQFTYTDGDGDVTEATSIECDGTDEVVIGFPDGTVDTDDDAVITYTEAADPESRIVDASDNEATNNDVVGVDVEQPTEPEPTPTETEPTEEPTPEPTETETPPEPSEDFVVDTTSDEVDADVGDGICSTTADDLGPCSLRAAVQEANATDDASTIQVPDLGSSYLIGIDGRDEDQAATGDLDVTTTITITGDGEDDVRVNGTATDRIFDVLDADLTLSGVTLEFGRVDGAARGGAIRVSGDGAVLDLSSSTVRFNQAGQAGGGIENTGASVTMTDVDLVANGTGGDAEGEVGNGGGLHAAGGTTDVVGGAVVGNNAVEGGGLWIGGGGELTVDTTLVKGNVALGEDAEQGGGGLYNDGATLTLTEVLVGGTEVGAGNRALRGSGSGGGVFAAGGTTTVDGGIVSGNTAPRAGGGIEITTGTLDVTGTLLEGNIAGVDQANPGNGGAVHVSADAATTFTDVDIVDNLARREGGGLWNQAGATMTVQGTSTLTGNVAEGDAADDGGGAIFDNGGVLVVTETTIGSGSLDDGNHATGTAGSGGGIHTRGGTVTVDDSTIAFNTAERAGGGIEAADGADVDLGVTGSLLVVGNEAGVNPGNGGGVHQAGGTVDIGTQVRFERNRAVEGGAAWVGGGGTMTVAGSPVDPDNPSTPLETRTTFLDNVATGNAAEGADAIQGGGALYNENATLDVEGSHFEGNTATEDGGSGGAIVASGGATTVTGSIFIANLADRAGGAIEVDTGTLDVAGSDFDGNVAEGDVAPGNGGAVHNGGGTVTITDGSAVGNGAVEGGAFWTAGPNDFTVTGTTVTDNTASSEGGAFYNSGGSFVFTDVDATTGGLETDDTVQGNVYAEGTTEMSSAVASGSTFTDSADVAEPTCERFISPVFLGNQDDDGTCFDDGMIIWSQDQ